MPKFMIAVAETVDGQGQICVNGDHIETDSGTLLVFATVDGTQRVPLAIAPGQWYYVLVTNDENMEYLDIVEWPDKGY